MIEATGCDIEYGFTRELTEEEMDLIINAEPIDWDEAFKMHNTGVRNNEQ